MDKGTSVDCTLFSPPRGLAIILGVVSVVLLIVTAFGIIGVTRLAVLRVWQA